MSDSDKCSLCGFPRHHDRHRFVTEAGFHHFQYKEDETHMTKTIKALTSRIEKLERILAANGIEEKEQVNA